MVQETAQAEFLISISTTGQNVYTDDPKTTEDALTKESQGAWEIEAQRIYPVGKAWLIKNKVVPLQHESYPTAACHPSRCADRQF